MPLAVPRDDNTARSSNNDNRSNRTSKITKDSRYSEEARRRYAEYRKQWNKYGITKKNPNQN
ncbi:hypothetical protein DICVIV_10833 [Dictyocaulus viviparus]|uniref:Uncharacterized protein n=1 Tax=Dictyocaulus viviparus TaxID=29172 RepID=A0A0D8XHB7_DICVI|nr:hypothetical protein DICVIV_10833 [Dictyocaulus viviparus]